MCPMKKEDIMKIVHVMVIMILIKPLVPTGPTATCTQICWLKQMKIILEILNILFEIKKNHFLHKL